MNSRLSVMLMAKKSLRFIVLAIFVCSASAGFSETFIAKSPNNKIQLSFQLDKGVPTYKVDFKGKSLIRPSRLGFELRNKEGLHSDFIVVDSAKRQVHEPWEQVWGENRFSENRYEELVVKLAQPKSRRQMDLHFKVFDDGVGFRYVIPKQKGLEHFSIVEEKTEFHISQPMTAWWIPAFFPNRYEYLYSKSELYDLASIQVVKAMHTPLTLQAADGVTLSIHEAALTDFSSMTLNPIKGGLLQAKLVPWSDGDKVKAKAPMQSPWRTIQIGEQSIDLIGSSLLLNLNEPSKISDASWIKPSKYIGIWWGMHIGAYTWGSGKAFGATTERTKRYIDFAAEHGFSGVLVEGWNQGWDGNWIENGENFSFTKSHPQFDLKEVTQYARQKKVYLIGHHETSANVLTYEKQLSKAFALYKKMGVPAIKTGYVGHGQEITRIDEKKQIQKEWHHGQYMVRHYRKVLEQAAQNEIMLNVHEPIKATGIRRTYPNMMSREGARGQEYNAWGEGGGNPPSYTTILPFTRSLAGPFDFTPGVLKLKWNKSGKNQIPTTVAKQLALYVTIFSPMHMAADLIENYQGRRELNFIKKVPVDWQKTIPLLGEIGEYVVLARQDRNSADWYIGAITNEEKRVVTIPLSFLKKTLSSAGEWVMELYSDGKNAHYQSQPEDINIRSFNVKPEQAIKVYLAPGGGAAARIRLK